MEANQSMEGDLAAACSPSKTFVSQEVSPIVISKSARVVAAVAAALNEGGSPLAKVPWTHHNVVAAFVVVETMPTSEAHDMLVYVVGMGSGTRSVGFAKSGTDDEDKQCQWRQNRLFTLDDGHAEVIAHRAMHVYFLDCMERLIAHERTCSDGNAASKGQPQPSSLSKKTAAFLAPFELDPVSWRFVWKPSVELHLVVSQVPCGSFGVTPLVPEWSTGAHVLLETPRGRGDGSPLLAARAVKTHFGHKVAQVMDESLHLLRAVPRTKPGAGTPSLSMSCSDKILRWCREGVEGKCLRRLFSTLHKGKGLCGVHIPLRSNPVCDVFGHCTTDTATETTLATLWERDITTSFSEALVAAGLQQENSAGTSMRVEATATTAPPHRQDDGTPQLFWFPPDALIRNAQSSSVAESSSSLSHAVWPTSVSASIVGTSQQQRDALHIITYSWGSCVLNTRDGVVHGMTKARFVTFVEAARNSLRASERCPTRQILSTLSKVVLAECDRVSNGVLFRNPDKGTPPWMDQVDQVVKLGCGGAPILRWTTSIRAAMILETCRQLSSDASVDDPANDLSIEGHEAPKEDVRTIGDGPWWAIHPYCAFWQAAHASSLSPEERSPLWVQKWDVACLGL
jgi:hypothetical protein